MPLKVAVDISGQFSIKTGIHNYVDSLLKALYSLDLPFQLVAFAPMILSRGQWREVARDGLFDWLDCPRSRVDTAGSDFHLAEQPWVARDPRLRSLANKVQGRLLNPLKGRTAAGRIRRAARRYDLMHVPDTLGLSFLDYPARRTVVTIYDLTTVTSPHLHRAQTVAEWATYLEFAQKHSARILTISEHSKCDIVEHLGIPADRVDVTPLAARAATRRVEDPAQARAALAGLGLADTPFVLYSGTLEPRKNLPRLMEAFAQVIQEARLPEHKLVLAGGNWDGHDAVLRGYADELGLGERVVTTGYVSNEQMNALMSSCEAFAYVSLYEGFGLPPLEAMVCGAPVVASDTTSLPEVVGEAGLQVAPKDVGAIAGALHLLLTDPAENARRRALSLARAREFSWERTARLTLQSYKAAVA